MLIGYAQERNFGVASRPPASRPAPSRPWP